MKPRTINALFVLLLVATYYQGGYAQGESFVNVALNTSGLIGHPAGPFSLNFQLNDGSGTRDGNNRVIITNFYFGADGKAVGSPRITGGVGGSLTANVSILDTEILNSFIQEFMPGQSLSFTVLLTGNLDDGETPDQFSFAILDRTGAEIPTTSHTQAFLLVDISSPSPAIQIFAADPNSTPEGGGEPISVGQPVAEAGLSVEIAIKPGELPNSINVGAAGVIPVAVLSNSSFDAITQVDLDSLTFGRTGDELSQARMPHEEDVNGDGLLDIVCHFKTSLTGFVQGSVIGVLKGKTMAGTALQGMDSVRVIK